MKSLNTLVGLKPLETKSLSGYFVNDLPGLGSELLENLADRDALALADVWAKVKRRARLRLLDRLELLLDQKYGWRKSIFQTSALGLAAASFTFSAPTVESVGQIIEVSDRQGLDIFVDNLSFFLGAGTTGDAQAEFLDLATGDPLDVLDEDGQPLALAAVQLKPGLNVIEVNGRLNPIAQASFYVGITGLNGLDLATLNWRQASLDVSPDVGLAAAYRPGGAMPDSLIFVDGFGTGPLVADLRVECSLGQAIERRPRDWAACWLNLLGAEILSEKLNSPKTNYWASGNRAQAEENRQALETEFYATLGRLVKRLDVGQLCATCNTQEQGYSYQAAPLP